MKDILKEICDNKRVEIEAAKQKVSLAEVKVRAEKAPAPKGFFKALEKKKLAGKPGLIAEVKKKSPSKGIIREDFNHTEIANIYKSAGADCISVLTDEKYFAGKDSYFADIRAKVATPLIRKDFMLDVYQIYESRALGADCILLIMAALEKKQALELEKVAHDLGMDALVEVHNEAELKVALELKSKLIGVNNRDLKTMVTSLNIGKSLSKLIPADYIKVCESGINDNAQVREMMAAGYHAFLVGESLMRQENIEKAVKELIS